MEKRQDQNKGKPACSFRKLSLPDNPPGHFLFFRGHRFGSIREVLKLGTTLCSDEPIASCHCQLIWQTKD